MPDPLFEASPQGLDGPARRLDWCPDLPDHRDYSLAKRSVAALLGQLKSRRSSGEPLTRVDWREFGSPIPSASWQASSAVEACLTLIEHSERRASGRLVRLSRAFLDYTATRLGGGEMGTRSLRTVLKAARRCGVPPEKHWPAAAGSTPAAPDAFAFCFQRYFGQIRGIRLDAPQTSGDDTLRKLRAWLTAGFPIACGFPVYNSMGGGPDISFPTACDELLGGLAGTVVGFDDRLRIRSDKGALLVRTVWGENWGQAGHGWLPYTYVRQRLATDFWTLVKPSWTRSGEFDSPVA